MRGWSTRQSTLFSTFWFVYRCTSSSFQVILLFLIGIGRRAHSTTPCIEGIWRSFEDRLPIVIYIGHCVWWPEHFESCIPLDMNIKGTSVSPTLSIDQMSVSTLSCSGISLALCLPPPVCSVHFGIETFQWPITYQASQSAVNKMLSVHWLPHQP
jgi:hypothetical protein